MSPAEREVIAKAVKELDAVRKKSCSTCNDTGVVPHTGRGGDGFDPCPDCDAEERWRVRRVADDLRGLLEDK